MSIPRLIKIMKLHNLWWNISKKHENYIVSNNTIAQKFTGKLVLCWIKEHTFKTKYFGNLDFGKTDNFKQNRKSKNGEIYYVLKISDKIGLVRNLDCQNYLVFNVASVLLFDRCEDEGCLFTCFASEHLHCDRV